MLQRKQPEDRAAEVEEVDLVVDAAEAEVGVEVVDADFRMANGRALDLDEPRKSLLRLKTTALHMVCNRSVSLQWRSTVTADIKFGLVTNENNHEVSQTSRPQL
jgi:hypothetical protein